MMGPLFTIETNLHFPRVAVATDPEIGDVARAFGFDGIDSVAQIEKRNRRSRLFRVHSGNRRVMIRAVPQEIQPTTEIQCMIAAMVEPEMTVVPLRTRSGSFTHVSGRSAWMAYDEVKGRVFSGSVEHVPTIIETAARLHHALAKINSTLSAAARARLPVRVHAVEEWPELFRRLALEAQDVRWDKLRIALGGDGRAILSGGRDVIEEALRSASDLLSSTPVSLVHADLQHANVLMRSGRPIFLDVEDIGFDGLEIALAHAAFKLLRHSAYVGRATCDEIAGGAIPAVCALLARSGYAIETPHDLWRYGAFRILSDVYAICRLWLDEGDDSLLFDLEKRVHNLFELRTLTGERHGS